MNALGALPAMLSLRLPHIPLFVGKSSSEARAEVIARLPNLSAFNGSAITLKDRMDSERGYLRRILQNLSEVELAYLNSIAGEMATAGAVPSATMTQVLRDNPQLLRLRLAYASELDYALDRTNARGGSGALSSDMLEIRIVNLSSKSSGSTSEAIRKRVPSSLTVGKLRLMLQQLCGVSIQDQLLSFRCDLGGIPMTLDDDNLSLQYFGVLDGAEVFVSESS